MTQDEIVHQFRARVLAHADTSGNVAETCRTFGISRKSFYKWRNLVQRYGLEALTPKTRRVPQMPNATPTHVVERLLTLAIEIPTLGCRQYGDGLADAGGSRYRSRPCSSSWTTMASAVAPSASLERLRS